MKHYRYTGEVDKDFPTLGARLRPGDVVWTADQVEHHELALLTDEDAEALREFGAFAMPAPRKTRATASAKE